MLLLSTINIDCKVIGNERLSKVIEHLLLVSLCYILKKSLTNQLVCEFESSVFPMLIIVHVFCNTRYYILICSWVLQYMKLSRFSEDHCQGISIHMILARTNFLRSLSKLLSFKNYVWCSWDYKETILVISTYWSVVRSYCFS